MHGALATDAGPIDDARAVIRSFMAVALKGQPLADDADIFASGAVNSLFAMELILFTERTFGITIETEDLDIENFRSVARVAELVERKTGGIAAGATHDIL